MEKITTTTTRVVLDTKTVLTAMTTITAMIMLTLTILSTIIPISTEMRRDTITLNTITTTTMIMVRKMRPITLQLLRNS
jgi:hypothetical protein